MSKKHKQKMTVHLSECKCGASQLSEDDVRDKVSWASRKLAALAELMENYSPGGDRGEFGGARYEHLDYPGKISGLGEILVGIAAELAWLTDTLEKHGVKASKE